MYKIQLSHKILSVLNQSGYHSKYYINEYDYEEILDFYEERGFLLSDNIKQILGVFGNREILFHNQSNPNRQENYEISFNIRKVWGKFTPFLFSLMEEKIKKFETQYSLKSLVPIAIMESGPMIFFMDSKENIFGFIDELIVSYKGYSGWTSLEILFDGKEN